MPIEWNDKYQIGEKRIDDEHKELFRIANIFLNATSQESQRASAMQLRSYTKEHFWHEELLMHDLGYPLTTAHLKMHTELLTKLGAIEEKIERGELFQPELEEFINFWFIKHMATLDASLVVYVRKQMAQ